MLQTQPMDDDMSQSHTRRVLLIVLASTHIPSTHQTFGKNHAVNQKYQHLDLLNRATLSQY